MAQVSKEIILQQPEEQNLPYFIIWDLDGKTRIYQNLEDPEANPIKTRNLLSDFFEKTSGTVIVQLQAKDSMRGGDTRQTVKMQTHLSGQNYGNQAPAISGVPSGANIEQILQMQRENHAQQIKHLEEQHRRDLEILEIRRELQEAKNDDFFSKHGETIAGLLPLLFKGGAMPAPVINGIPETQAPTDINQLLNRWQAVDKDYLNNLEKLIILAETKPEAYNQGINLINGMI